MIGLFVVVGFDIDELIYFTKFICKMNTLQLERLYKTCAAYPMDLKDDSSLKIHSLWIEDSRVKEISICLCEHTSMK